MAQAGVEGDEMVAAGIAAVMAVRMTAASAHVKGARNHVVIAAVVFGVLQQNILKESEPHCDLAAACVGSQEHFVEGKNSSLVADGVRLEHRMLARPSIVEGIGQNKSELVVEELQPGAGEGDHHTRLAAVAGQVEALRGYDVEEVVRRLGRAVVQQAAADMDMVPLHLEAIVQAEV